MQITYTNALRTIVNDTHNTSVGNGDDSGNGGNGGDGGDDKGGNADCVDHDTQCSGWASRGECTNNPNWMNVNCRKACNKCHSKGNSNILDGCSGSLFHTLEY